MVYIRNARLFYFLILAIINFPSLFACSTIDQNAASNQQATIQLDPSPTTAPSSYQKPTAVQLYPETEIIPINPEWNTYINHRLGFSMNIPTSMYRSDAGCVWKEDGDNSWRPEGGHVPVTVIEGEDRVYITSESIAILTQATQIPSGNGYRYVYGGCERLKNSLEMVANREYSSYIWEIAIRPIESEADLEDLIDAYYGACYSVGEILPLEGKDYYQVKVEGDGKSVEDSECLLRGGYEFVYSPEFRIAATWGTGQMVHFSSGESNEVPKDGEMISSFTFLSREMDP
jgi:hypothetical protein